MVRYYGMYSNRKISKQIQKGDNHKSKDTSSDTWRDLQILKTGVDPLICPCCNKEMILVNEYYDNRTRWVRELYKDHVPSHWDSVA